MPQSPLHTFTADDIVYTVREPLLVLSGDLRVRNATRSFYRTFQVTPDDTLGRLVYELGNGQWDIPALRRFLEEVLPQQSNFDDFEVTHDFDSIGRKVMLLNARRNCREGNQTDTILLAIEDVTQQRQAEQAVRDALEYAENIVETVREPMVVLDGRLRVTSANRSFYRTFDTSVEETHGRYVYDLGNGQWNIPKLRSLLEDILPQKTTFDDFEVTHDFESIGRKTMLLNARRIYRKDDQTKLILLAIEDVTERRRLEDERRELETRFTSLVKNIRDHSIFTLNLDGCISSWNREAERILGYTEAEAVGRHFSVIFTPEDQSAGVPAQELATALSEGRAEDERWHLRSDGERFWALGIVTPTQDAEGNHTGFSKILRDMTDRKRAEESLQQADRRKDEFLATLAHELRNPLAPISSAVQLLGKMGPPYENLGQLRELIERNVNHMVRLVDDLMEVSRITTGKIELRQERLSLTNVVRYAVETSRPLIEARRHELAVDLPPQPVEVEGDVVRLTQVVSNLLNNAAKYTPDGGRIRISVERPDAEGVVRVRDNGPGIPTGMLDKVFDLFTQVNEHQGGLGIGLALVKRLVTMHGGTVEARHASGGGAEFVVRLPLVSNAGQPIEGEYEAAKETGHGSCRILVVDDNREAADCLAILLSVDGHQVSTAYDGSAAVRQALTFNPDVILLDLGMPGMDGFETAGKIRQLDGGTEIVIAALTGWGQEKDRRRTRETGFDFHLVKPMQPGELRHVLEEAISSKARRPDKHTGPRPFESQVVKNCDPAAAPQKKLESESDVPRFSKIVHDLAHCFFGIRMAAEVLETLAPSQPGMRDKSKRLVESIHKDCETGSRLIAEVRKLQARQELQTDDFGEQPNNPTS
jgi:PAS domain S-box-containing protein